MGNQIHLDLPRRRTNNSMMQLALIGLYCLQATLAATPSKAQAEEWEAWKQEHGKTYPTTSDAKSWLGEFSEEESFRMNIWAENKAAIEKHNREFNEGVHSFHLGMNHFGDLRGHEFASIMNGLRANPENKMNESNFLVSARSLSLPASVDWRKKGAVTHVKDQAQCGSCWAFSAFHQFYHGGVISSPTCSSSNLDHAVLVVGYGKCSKTGKDFWLIKNSWGSSWGEEGYFKLARNENNMCGVATIPFFPRD